MHQYLTTIFIRGRGVVIRSGTFGARPKGATHLVPPKKCISICCLGRMVPETFSTQRDKWCLGHLVPSTISALRPKWCILNNAHPIL